MLQKHPSESTINFLATYSLGICLFVITIGAAKTLGSIDALAWLLGMIAIFSTRIAFSTIAKRQKALISAIRNQSPLDSQQ